MSSIITADRINNKIGHSLSNCEICCMRCNASTSDVNRVGRREIKIDNIEFIDNIYNKLVCSTVLAINYDYKV